MARNKKVEILSHDGQVLHPITDGDCVIFPDGETLTRKLSEDEAVMYTPEVTNSSPMFKVGEGDSSDYSANVLDGAYQEAVLKGQTYVNTIQEPSADVITLPTPFTEYERTQSKTFTEMQDGTFGLNLVGQSYVNRIQEPSEPSYVALGENLEFQNKKVEYTTDGQIKSAMLNGQTLVNISKPAIGNGNTVSTYANIGMTYYQPKSNTKYFCYIENLANDTFTYYLNNITFNLPTAELQRFTIEPNSIVTKIVTTVENPDKYGLWLSVSSSNEATEKQNLRIMLIEYQEGMENWDIPYFQGMQSVTMSTELENVCRRYNSSLAKGGTTFTANNHNSRALTLSNPSDIAKYNFKPNTKYLIQFKITNLNLDGSSSITLVFSKGDISTGDSLFGNFTNCAIKIRRNGIYRIALTTSNIVSTSSFVIKGYASEWEDTTSTTRKLTISQIMCIEYQNGMEKWDLPYFETTQLMKPLKVQSINKNLLDIGGHAEAYNGASCSIQGNQITINSNGNYTYPNIQYILDKKLYGKTIFISYEVIQNTSPNWHMQFIYTSKTTGQTVYLNARTGKIKIPNKEDIKGKIKLGIYPDNTSKTGTAHILKLSNIQLEEVESNVASATPYTPHQSKTISALEPITLRAIGNVKDTLDLSTGEYIQRIGEIILDGSDDEGWRKVTVEPWTNDTYTAFEKDVQTSGIPGWTINGIYVICDKYKSITYDEARNNGLGCLMYDAAGKRMCIRQTTITSLADFKTSLQNNPIKVQYELANPITRKISLEYPNLQTYQDITHVQSIAMDGTLIPKIFLPSDISYRAMLKPNTSYNVIVDREVIDSTNQLTVNLGGTTANITANRTVVTTPSTLSSETLTFSGKDNRIAKAMLIEGGTLINGDLPHFDGIGDVKLGRVVENLCLGNENLAGSFGNNATVTQYQDKFICKLGKQGSLVACFSLTKQLLNGKKYFAYCPWDCSSSSHTFGAGFRMRCNGNDLFGQQIKVVDNKKYIIFTIDEKEQLNPYIQFTIGHHGNMPVNTTLTFYRPILCEYVDGMENWDWESIGYFTGTKNVGNEFMRISNKNLFGEVVNRYWDAPFTNSNETIRPVPRDNAYSVRNIKVKKGRTYTASGNGFTRSVIAYFKTNSIDELPFDGSLQNFNYTFTSKYDGYVEWYLSNDNVNNPVTNVQIEEASSATSYVAHKHNSLHILPDKQIPLTFEQGTIAYAYNGTWANAINNANTTRIRTQLIDLEPNETYRVSCGHSNHGFGVQGYSNDLLAKSDSGWTYDYYYFTTTKDVHKYAINVRYKDNSNVTPSALHQVRLEKVTDVHLRSVKNVKDELDLTRGVYVQRINEKILDGSYGISRVTNKDTCTIIQYNVEDKKQGSNYNPISNKFNRGDWDSRIPYEVYCGNSYDMYFVVPLGLNITTIDEAKAWFKNNNVIAQYELATPIIHKINIPMKNESNQTIAKPNGIFTLPLMYSETNHVDINSQIYPKVQSRDYISYPVIANNSQLHTVFHNKVGTGNLTVDLCGTSVTSVDGASKCTITTPSSISQYELRLSGARNKVSNVCVFNGDYMNVNVPYVQGMMNAVNPIVKNASLNHADIATSGSTNFYIGRVYKGRTYSLKLDMSKNVGYNLVLRHGKTKNDGEKMLKESIYSDFTTFTSNYSGYLYFNGWENVDVDNIMLCLGTYTKQNMPQYEPYKENNCQPDYGQIKLTRDMFEQGSFNELSSVKNYYETKTATSHSLQLKRIRLIDPIPVKPNTKYIVKFNRLEDYDIFVAYFKNNERVGFEGYWKNKEFTTPSDCNQIVFVLKRKGDAQILVDDIDYSKLIFSKVDETIHLRSLPNGVHDELNLETGEYVQRIGEINIRDLSKMNNMVRKGGWDNGTYMSFDIITPDAVQNKTNAIITASNLFPTVIRNLESSESMKEFVTNTASGNLFVMIRKDRLLSADLNGFKQWLEDNDLVIQYELATPVIKQVDIHNYPHSYKDGHVIIENGDPTTSVPAQLTYKCVTNRSGQIQEHTEQVEKQERQINELETLILENIRQNQNRSQNFLTSLISTLEIEEE